MLVIDESYFFSTTMPEIVVLEKLKKRNEAKNERPYTCLQE